MKTTIHYCGLAEKDVNISEPINSGVYFITTNQCSRFRMPTDAAAFLSYSDHSPSERPMSTNFVPRQSFNSPTIFERKLNSLHVETTNGKEYSSFVVLKSIRFVQLLYSSTLTSLSSSLQVHHRPTMT